MAFHVKPKEEPDHQPKRTRATKAQMEARQDRRDALDKIAADKSATQQRKLETRQKIIIGGYLIGQARSGNDQAARVLNSVYASLENERDKAAIDSLFQDGEFK